MSISSPSTGCPEEDAWFHGNITREAAEELLLKDGEEGSFLVRESTSSIGDFAISVLSAETVHHVQIKRHADERDAFFSLEGDEVIHGLDELIKFYQSPTSNTDAILLQKPITKSPPPPDCRRHGRTNLLHRATKERSTAIVLEMVRCGHRSLDAKNEEGQTAVHLAAMQGFNDILSILLKAGTNANAKDSDSCTPLHYACINNLPETVQVLIKEGVANPQVRRNETGWVPMHEAAFRGHLDCIGMLYRYHAPLRPRTADGKLPIHLAIENNHEETIRFFDTVNPRKTRTNRDDWYHGVLNRSEAKNALKLAHQYSTNVDPSDANNSFFLIRRHSKIQNTYVLTLLAQEQLYNYQIGREGNFYYIDDGPYLDSLEHIVEHYSRWPDGLPSLLQIPVNPTQTFAQPLTSTSTSKPNTLEIPPPLPKRTPMSSSPNALNHFCNDMANNNRPVPPFSKDNIPSELIELGKVLGGGEYGEVYEGKLTMGSSILEVAIKTLKTDEGMHEATKKEFLQEAQVMMELQHEHIVKIIGICWSPKIYMVQELLKLGSLEDYLVEHPDEVDPTKDFRMWAHQIAKGMVYLERKRVVHRDLAARNILLSGSRVAKISDFGLSRDLGMESYYRASQGGRWPIKWYSPESYSHGTFTHASDVWSYGITLWELYSFGNTPYGDRAGRDVIDMVDRGERLEKPRHCPDNVYGVMKKCWSSDPNFRPSFTFLENFFADPVVPAVSPEKPEEPKPEEVPVPTFQDDISRSMESVQLIDL